MFIIIIWFAIYNVYFILKTAMMILGTSCRHHRSISLVVTDATKMYKMTSTQKNKTERGASARYAFYTFHNSQNSLCSKMIAHKIRSWLSYCYRTKKAKHFRIFNLALLPIFYIFTLLRPPPKGIWKKLSLLLIQ